MRDFSTPSKSKDGTEKDSEFGAAHVLDILLRNWFLVELSNFDPEHESDDDDHHNTDFKICISAPGVPTTGEPIDMNDVPNGPPKTSRQRPN